MEIYRPVSGEHYDQVCLKQRKPLLSCLSHSPSPSLLSYWLASFNPGADGTNKPSDCTLRWKNIRSQFTQDYYFSPKVQTDPFRTTYCFIHY